MRRVVDLIDRCNRRIPRDSRRARVFEPLARMLKFRGTTRFTLRFVRHHGLTVGAGPFAGLRYPRSALLHASGLVTQLAGTYELELHGVVEALVRAQPRLIVNIGAGDGYYLVGMALRCPDAHLVGFEADPYRARVCADLARFNAVTDRLDLRGACTAEGLARLDPPHLTAVICDCDGAEAELIDPAQVGWLRRATLLVEVHEPLEPGVEAKLHERLHRTHSLEWIQPSRRYLADPTSRMLWSLGLSPFQLEMLMSELRPVPTPWLWARPS